MLRYISTTSLILLVAVTSVSGQETSTPTIGAEQLSEEALAWQSIKNSTTSAEVFAFTQAYPDGEFTQQAKALMIDLLWAEMEQTPGSEPEAVTAQEEEVVTVTFSSTLTVGAPEIVGKSLEELIEGMPLYPPVEGLPVEFWEEQQCSSCHQWEEANLCTQANTYMSDAGSENLTKEHPYGGTFKLNLLTWALGGCE